MTLAAFVATGFAVAGIHAWMLRRAPANAFHRRALGIGLAVAVPAVFLQLVSGDISARAVARQQPAKLAAMESLFKTTSGAPLLIGGWPDPETQTVRFGIAIPKGLSFLATHDPDAVIPGLDRVPREDWPPVRIVHSAFQLMVALGTGLAALGLWAAIAWWRTRDLSRHPRLLLALALATPAGFIAIEAGWVVTEVGRQPWIIQDVLRTAEAVTPMPGLPVPLVAISLLYLMLAAVVVGVLRRQVSGSPSMPEPGGGDA
jgi:cytochrome d ubiquinol oxidase subunit I